MCGGGAPGKVGGSKSTQETCEKSTEVRRAVKGPLAPFMLFLAGAQTSSFLYLPSHQFQSAGAASRAMALALLLLSRATWR